MLYQRIKQLFPFHLYLRSLRTYFYHYKTIKTIRIIYRVILQILFPDQRVIVKQLKGRDEIIEAYDLFAKRNTGAFAYNSDTEKMIKNDRFHPKAQYYGIYKNNELLASARILSELQYDYKLRRTTEPLSRLRELSMLCKKPGVSTHYVIMLFAYIAETLRPLGITTLTMMQGEGVHRAGVTKQYGSLFTRNIPEPVELKRSDEKTMTHVYDFDLTKYYHPHLSLGLGPYLICKIVRALVKH